MKLGNYKSSIKTKLKLPTLLASLSSYHGSSYYFALKGRSRGLWILLMIFNAVLTALFLLIIRGRFNNKQIVTKIYSDWGVDKTPFPAVSICNFNVVSLKEMRVIENILKENKIPEKEIESFFYDLHYLTNFGSKSDKVPSHSEVMKVLRQHYYSVVDIMTEVHQKCENLLVYCAFNGVVRKCSDIFDLVPTTVGFCCTFNFEGIEGDADNFVTIMEDSMDDLDYYFDTDTGGKPIRTNIIATSRSGRGSGLQVIFNVEPQDYPPWSDAKAYGAKILLSDPHDYIESKVLSKRITAGQSLGLKVEPQIYQSRDDIRYVSLGKRNCWFPDEVHLKHTVKYSTETCETECRIMNYKKSCGCVPYKYPSNRSNRICEFSDLACLHYMSVYWDKVKRPCNPVCHRECRERDFTVSDEMVPFLSQVYPEGALQGHNESELASVHVFYIKPTCNCYMKTLLTDTNTFIATYGGIFSLAFGVSMITVCELVYLSLASLGNIIWRRDNTNSKLRSRL